MVAASSPPRAQRICTTKALALALPKICVGHSAAVLTGLEHNHKRWLSVTSGYVLPTSCNDRFLQLCFGLKHNQPPPQLRVKTGDGGCRSMFAIVKQTSSTQSRGLGWRIHESVEDTKLSTIIQHTLSFPDLRACTRLLSVAAAPRCSPLLLPEARRCCWLRQTLGVSAAAACSSSRL